MTPANLSGIFTPAAFLDRDGVINHDAGYVHSWTDFRFLPRVVDALRDLQYMGFLLIVITNQSGIARGIYSESDYHALTARIDESLREQGVYLTRTYHCPHYSAGSISEFRLDCNCRKPATGMIDQALLDFQIDLQRSILIGDKPSDIEAGFTAGVARRFLVRCNGVDPYMPQGQADACFDDLSACVQELRRQLVESSASNNIQ
jgi:D-glycero-D-manno-heptose 1,7-bisphosphate phosphatase